MRDVQLQVGGKGATIHGGPPPSDSSRSFEAIVARGKDLADKLDKSEGILYEAPLAKNLTYLVRDTEALYDATGRRKISNREAVWVRFENGLFLLKKDDKNFDEILTFLEGKQDEAKRIKLPAHRDFNHRFWRVEEAARKLHEDALKSAVMLIKGSGKAGATLAKDLIAQLQDVVGVEVVEVERPASASESKGPQPTKKN